MADLNDEQLDEIQKYADAFRQEFETAEAESENYDAIKNKVDDIEKELDESVPYACAAIKHVLKHSTNLAVKVSTAKWLLDKKLAAAESAKDPINLFIEAMQEATKEAAENGKVTTPNE